MYSAHEFDIPTKINSKSKLCDKADIAVMTEKVEFNFSQKVETRRKVLLTPRVFATDHKSQTHLHYSLISDFASQIPVIIKDSIPVTTISER